MSEPFLGEIKMIGFNFPPRGWAFCDGQILPIAQYQALFSLLGTTFGGDGRTTFGLPELRGRDPIHPGSGPGLPTYRWGERGGRASMTLTTSELPSHNHTVIPRGNTGGGGADSPANGFPAEHEAAGDSPYANTGNTNMGAADCGNAGGQRNFSIQNPYTGVYHCIALVGIFPSRN